MDWLREFVGVLKSEGRRSVLDVGAGPASDAALFIDAGIDYTGLDLATANAELAAEVGARVVPASMFDVPFRDGSFEACWSMSTLMHSPTDHVDAAMRSICRTLVPGSPVMVGQWGGSLGDIESDHTVPGLPRLFSLRTAQENRALLEAHGSIERWEVRSIGPDGWEYHAAVLRRAG